MQESLGGAEQQKSPWLEPGVGLFTAV